MLFRCFVTALAGGLALEAAAGPVAVDNLKKRSVPVTHNLHERHLPHWSKQWNKRSKIPSSAMLPMRIGLRQSNVEAGESKLLDISNPRSANYGSHMTSEEVIDFFAPAQSTVDSVIDWLVSSGISRNRVGQSTNKQWIQFDATAEEVGDLLYTDFYVWEHGDGSTDVSCEEYHLPGHIQEHVDYITPGTRLRNNAKQAKRAEKRDNKPVSKVHPPKQPPTRKLDDPSPPVNSTNCDSYIYAGCVRAQYGFLVGTTAFPGNELGIFESLDDHYSRDDLDGFFSTLYPYIPNGTYPEERRIDGALGAFEEQTDNNPIYDGVGIESSLDFDASWPLIWPQRTVLFQTDDENYEQEEQWSNEFPGFWNTFLDAIDGSYCSYTAFGETGDCTDSSCADPSYPDPTPYSGFNHSLECGVYKPTNVISISYGAVEYALPDNYLRRQCNEWMKLALQGTTIVMSSGDSGVGDFSWCPGDDGQIFAPSFAATCPWILSVGSTVLKNPDPSTALKPWQKLEEVATDRFASGGGFSNVFASPDYQRGAVTSYLRDTPLNFTGYDLVIPNGNFSAVGNGVFNSGGRGYPDVSAIGDNQVIFAAGEWWLVGGTSLSAPIWASALTLINEERLRLGKRTLGFINPILYEHPEVFNDITVGNNPGCQTNSGFVAAKGWDPVSGLGSPNFADLQFLLLSF